MQIPRVLIVAGSDSGGGAGIQADLKAVSVHGAFGMTAITALTAQNTTGVRGVFPVTPAFVALQIDTCLEDIGADAVKTGMLATAPIVEQVAERLAFHRPPWVVVDPVMLAKSGAELLDTDAVEALRERLLPIATVVTPNLPEAEALTGIEITDPEGMKEAARRLHACGSPYVVVKGGHLAGDPVDILYDGRGFTRFEGERIPSRNTHGTGCNFASAIAANLARGKGVEESVRIAKRYIDRAIRAALPLGRGHGPADPMAWLTPRPV
ncbi:MAG: bifunctional hydroxymethylpyrimidine kinase/phosphomethylpyrimidine kinase [Deltaproteobacteria bacterium]|nr:MAG: bifunctional hydroxymethylpyrimidine kinase/phosphomethylpyrimidine kinase [Deltaproteobacteria bacterium]